MERRVIKIGNSKGITLPKEIKKDIGEMFQFNIELKKSMATLDDIMNKLERIEDKLDKLAGGNYG